MTFVPLVCSHLLAEPHTPLPTPLSDLNQSLHGGLPPGTLSEIYGVKSTFKTQFILTIAARTALQGSSALLLDSDASIHKVRLVQIISSLASSSQHAEEAVARVQIIRLTDWHALIATVHMLPFIVSQTSAQFVAVDTLSALFRTCNETAAFKRLEAVASRLRQVAVSRCITVLVTNGARATNDRQVVASAMGDAWRYVVGTRLMIQRTGESEGGIQIVKSGVCGGGRTTLFHVNETGITDVGINTQAS